MDKDGFFAEFGPTTVERQRPAVPDLENLLLVERAIVAVCDNADAQGDGEPAAELQAERSHHRTDYVKLLHDLHQDPPQGRQAVHRRGVQPGYRLVGGSRQLNHSEHYFHSQLQRSDHHRPDRPSPGADDVI